MRITDIRVTVKHPVSYTHLIADVGSDLLNFTMYANNETQANIMKLHFEQHTDLLYRTILAIGIGDKKAFSELLGAFEPKLSE